MLLLVNNVHEKTLQKVKTDKILKMSVHCLYFAFLGKISVQPHTTLCIQFLDRENNEKNNRLPLGKQICFTIVWGCAEILPILVTTLQLCYMRMHSFSANLMRIFFLCILSTKPKLIFFFILITDLVDIVLIL